jgi:hypothetical protein
MSFPKGCDGMVPGTEKTPNFLGLGVSKAVIGKELQLDLCAIGIDEATYNKKDETFWGTLGLAIVRVLIEVLGGAGARQLSGEKTKPTKSMQNGTVAHAGQIQQIVVAPKWKQFRLALNSKDLVADRMKIMQTIIDADTNAAKLIKKCVIFAGNMIAVTVKEEDTSRLHVTNTVRDYASLRGTIRCTALNDILIGYECHLNDITTSEIVLGAMGFVTATPATFHGSLDKAFALMLRCSAGELWHQSGQNLMEGMEALVRVLSSTLGNLVGESTNGGPVRSCANGLQ